MGRMRAFCLAAVMVFSGAYGLDGPFSIPGIPVEFHFNVGFTTSVVPGADDTSAAHNLYVSADKIRSDKKQHLFVAGTITNYGDVPREGIAMRFAVTSYVGTGSSWGWASVVPNCLQPGETAVFKAHIRLDSEKPRLAKYTVTAHAPTESSCLTGVPETRLEEIQEAIPETVTAPIADASFEDAPPVIEDAPPVVEDAPPVVEDAPPVVEDAPPVVEEPPPIVVEALPVVVEAPEEYTADMDAHENTPGESLPDNR